VPGRYASCGCVRDSFEYRSWNHMIGRCQNPNNSNYHLYGKRGITVCERWVKFENFYADMGSRPGREYSLERIDRNGNYESSNCCWATRKEQNRNTSRNRFFEYHGRQCTLAELAEIAKISHSAFLLRLKRGLSVEEAVHKPKKTR
jgi:hypothetical protein